MNKRKSAKLFVLSKLILLLVTLTTTNCNLYISKDGYIESFSKFISEVKVKSDSFTNEDWQKVDFSTLNLLKRII